MLIFGHFLKAKAPGTNRKTLQIGGWASIVHNLLPSASTNAKFFEAERFDLSDCAVQKFFERNTLEVGLIAFQNISKHCFSNFSFVAS